MKNSIKREQSQACLNFAERKNFRLQAKHKILMTLVALFAMTAGAWAQEEVLLTTVTATSLTTYSQSPDGIVTVTLDNIGSYSSTYGWLHGGSVTVEAPQGYTITRCVFKQNNPNYVRVLADDLAPFTATMGFNGEEYYVSAATSTGDVIGGNFMDGISSIEVYGTAEAPIEVTPVAGKTNEWTFTMPAYDVEIAPIYAPTAKWATEDNQVLAPTAIEGVFAESTGAIVTAGTVVKGQGTAMYAVTSTNQATAPALDAFSADVPTAKDITAAGDVLVWYYIKGADTPQGQDPTAENTFNDSEICATPLTVTVLSNKFDITFNAANANTIEAGKATVTVGGTAATVTEGKLEGVKMGSEVKMTAKEGYKFRKVEGKKKASTVPVTAITLNKTETSIKVGATETLSVTSVLPEEATDKTYTWKTSDETKATVDQDGKVTAVAAGTVTIYAEANDGSGVKGNCSVTVTPATITVTINQSDWGNSWSSFTKDGVTVSAGMIDPMEGNLMSGGTFSTTLGNFTKIEVTCEGCDATGTGWSSGRSSQTWAGTPASTVNFSGTFMGMGMGITIVCTIEPTN